MLTLYQFAGNDDVASFSPYCLKLETCLRIFDVPFKVRYTNDLKKAPKGKMPFVEHQGETVGDSELIITRLQDQGLLPPTPPQDIAFIRMIDTHLAVAMVHSRWVDDANFSRLSRIFFAGLPPVVRRLVPKLVRRNVAGQLRGHGMGRHAASEIAVLGKADIAALAARLGDRPYFGGDTPGLLDAAAYGTLANLLLPQFPSPLLDAVRSHANLTAFCTRMQQRYFPRAARTAA